MNVELNTEKKQIIHCYVKRLRYGRFDLFTQAGNALPVRHSQNDSFLDADREARSIGAVSCKFV